MAKGKVAAPISDDPVLAATKILSDVPTIVDADAAIGPDPEADAVAADPPVIA